MFDAGTLTFQEFATTEPLPLATIQNSVLKFLRGRDDGVVCGAQAVNAYVNEPRMSQDVDLLARCCYCSSPNSSRLPALSQILRATRVEAEVLAAWDRLVEQEIQPPDEDDEF